MQATAISLANGQTAWVILLGLSLILYGIDRENTLLTAFGLTLVMLKPQIGIPILATHMVTRRLWPAVVIAGIFSVLLSLPAVMINGLSKTFFAFLETIPHYALHAVNAPSSMTGIQNLIWETIKLNINSVVLFLTATIAAAVITIKLRQIIGHEKQAVMRALFVTLAIILAVVPLHTYDFIIAAPFVFLFLGYRRNARWLLLVAVTIIFRSDNFGKWTGFHSDSTVYFFGSTLNSIASIFFLISIIWLAFDKRMECENLLSSRPKETLLQ